MWLGDGCNSSQGVLGLTFLNLSFLICKLGMLSTLLTSLSCWNQIT